MLERTDTPPTASRIADVQSAADGRNIAIDEVGIKGLRYPLTVEDLSGAQPTVATVNMYVRLPAQHKGTHMSRFLEVLHAHQDALSVRSFHRLPAALSARLDAPAARVELSFAYFINKRAPVSGAQSLLDTEVTLSGHIDHEANASDTAVKIVTPVTTLCPCSKEISEYGAHNQRSHVTVEVRATEAVAIEELIGIVEAQASCELYGVLKRPDEKYITEKAYDNPKFVEDTARDVAAAFNTDPRITAYTVSVENFESIHNHSAFARIFCDKSDKARHSRTIDK